MGSGLKAAVAPPSPALYDSVIRLNKVLTPTGGRHEKGAPCRPRRADRRGKRTSGTVAWVWILFPALRAAGDDRLGGDRHGGRCGPYVGIHVRLKTLEVLLEHLEQALGGLGEGGFVLPGLDRIEDVRLDARYRGRHGETEIRVAPE